MRKKVFSRSRWQTYRERCHIAGDVPPPVDAEALPISRVIAGLMKTLDAPAPAWVRDITGEWTLLAGSTEAKHARPGRYQDGTLTVFVDDAVWLNELKRYWRTEMLKKLQNRFGEKSIRKLILQPDPDLQEPA